MGIPGMFKRLVYILFIPAIASVAACQDYDFKVNDKVVYSPALYRDYTTPDQGLRECLQQTIKDRGVTEPQQLDILHRLRAKNNCREWDRCRNN